MSTFPSHLIAGLGVLYYAILFIGIAVAYRTNRPARQRPDTSMWRVAPNHPNPVLAEGPAHPEPEPAPLSRAFVAFAGSALLATGSLMPSSLLVQSAALSSSSIGDVIYLSFATIAVLLAATRSFRLLYLVGGIPLLLLLTTGIESTILMERYAKPAQQYYGQLYGIGLSWIVMVAGAGLLVVSAALRPASKAFPEPPPPGARRNPTS